MTNEEIKNCLKNADGLKTYEFIVNHLHELSNEQLTEVVNNLAQIDHTGQYLASGVRYMNGIDSFKYSHHIKHMTALTIDRDREHNFIGDLISNLYGADYYDRVTEFSDDDNFRRMFKRLYPDGAL